MTASASSASGTASGSVPGPSDGVARGVATGGGGGAGGKVRANASNGRSGATPGSPHGAPGRTMKGATGRAFVDSRGGNDRCGKTYAKLYAKYSPKDLASAKNAGSVGGGYPADLGGSEENSGGGASAKGGDVFAAVGAGESHPPRLPEWAAGLEPGEVAC
jgi:hypothetical protein